MKYILSLCLIFQVILVHSGLAQNLPTDTTLFQIDFQDFFASDTVDLQINNYNILKNVIVSSEKSAGITELSLSAYKKSGKNILVRYFNNNKKIKSNSSKLSITILLNGITNHFEIDLNYGKYLGFSKRNPNILYFIQRPKPFFYD